MLGPFAKADARGAVTVGWQFFVAELQKFQPAIPNHRINPLDLVRNPGDFERKTRCINACDLGSKRNTADDAIAIKCAVDQAVAKCDIIKRGNIAKRAAPAFGLAGEWLGKYRFNRQLRCGLGGFGIKSGAGEDDLAFAQHFAKNRIH